MPAPARDTDCGLSAASSVMVTVAVRALAAVSVKLRLRTQLAPAASVAPLMQVVPEASAKSPALAPPSTAVAMLRGAVPLLVRVTECRGGVGRERCGAEVDTDVSMVQGVEMRVRE